MKSSDDIGLGCADFRIAVYIANRPLMSEYQAIKAVQPMVNGEINEIGLQCGNGWRKIFNVYAKLLAVLPRQQFAYLPSTASWQNYRDDVLLQKGSQNVLLFSPPNFDLKNATLHIIAGKTYAKQLLTSGLLDANLVWLDEQFAIDSSKRLIVSPYFDYRQLSNCKIDYLAKLLTQLAREID